jgi:hypothetical protein
MPDTIKALYPYALAEGEGVGTAYEYVAKAAFLQPVIAELQRRGPAHASRRFLVAGLPEKYGTSLDFAILASRCGAELCVADDRSTAIERARSAIGVAQHAGHLQGLRVSYHHLSALDAIANLDAHDAALSCEVLQRIQPGSRRAFVGALRARAPLGALFVPNAENAAHLRISGLSGFSRSEIEELFPGGRCGYVDMPPFPPGIARSAEQREKASTGLAEAVAMRMLDVYCAAERLVPDRVKKRFAHIVCATWGA